MAYVSVPGLAGLKEAVNAVKGNVNGIDVFMGMAAGIVGGKLFKAAFDQKIAPKFNLNLSQGVAKYASQYGESLGSLLTGGALYMAQKGSSRAKGHLAGAAAAAVVLPVADMVSAQVNKALSFGDYVSFNPALGQLRNDFSNYGALYNDPSQFGALYNDQYGDYVALPGSLGDLAATSAMTQEADEYAGY